MGWQAPATATHLVTPVPPPRESQIDDRLTGPIAPADEHAAVGYAAGQTETVSPPARPGFRRPLRAPLPKVTPSRTGVALAVILLIAAVLRLTGLNWDGGHHLHPDERFITQVAAALKIPGPEQYFDSARSPMNPNAMPNTSYVYGTWPLFVTRVVGEIVSGVARAVTTPDVTGFARHLREVTNYDNIHLLGRALSALADVGTLFVMFLIGRRLYGKGVGLLAALLGAFTVLMIQTAHFFTVEAPLTLFIVLAYYYAIRAADTGSLTDWSLFGVMTGLAAATKVSALMLVVVALGAAGIYWYRVAELGENAPRRRFLGADIVTGLFSAGALSFLAFRLAQPYTFNGPSIFNMSINARWLDVFIGFQRIGVGEADVPFNQVWSQTTPFIWQIQNMALWGMGVPLMVAAWLGVGFALWQLIRDPRRYSIHVLGLIWVLANFIYWGPQLTKLMRYQHPIYPMLIIFAAYALVAAWRMGMAARSRREAEKVDDDAAGTARLVVARPTGLTYVGRAFGVVVVGWTIFYGLAFTSIYTKPVSRVTASEWIFENVPRGSVIASEHWDDPLPLGAPGKDPTSYRGIGLELYNEENAQKRTDLIAKLDQADYIALSSNRLYGSIPRNPRRYPLATRYYHALFNGELGFERIADFTSRPSLLGIEINDDNAEESFTVYDHPKVTIFKKSDTYSTENVRAIFNAVRIEDAIPNLKPINAGSRALLLDPASWAATQAGGTWSAMFDRDSLTNKAPLPIWYAVVWLLGIAAIPITWLMCRRLADGGYAISKTVALIAISYVPWLMASGQLLPYTQASILLSVGLLLLVSGIVFVRHRRAILVDLAARRRPIFATEVLFFLVFFAFTGLRVVNPDLWHSAYGGEKPMDFAYLNAVIKTTWFPPYDPWFAGGYLNYYYWGQVIVASLIKLTGIVPWVAYNLAIPTVAALTATTLASVVYNVMISKPEVPVRRQAWAYGAGVMAVLLGLVGGNLHAIQQFLWWVTKLDTSPVRSDVLGVVGLTSFFKGLWIWVSSMGKGLPPFVYDFWGPTRVITTESTTPITEFPYFTFLYGDLHAHMIAMPLGMLAVLLALNLVRQPAWVPAFRGRTPRESVGELFVALRTPAALTLGFAALNVGLTRMVNSWDFPTYLGLTGAAVLLAEVLRPGRDWKVAIGRTLVLGAMVAVASQVLILPYLRSNELFYSGVQLSRDRTGLVHFIVIMGAFMAVLMTYLGIRLWALRARLGQGALLGIGAVSAPSSQAAVAAEATPSTRPSLHAPTAPSIDRWAGTIGIIALVALVFTLVGGSPVVGVTLFGIAALAIIALMRPLPAGTAFLFLLTTTALAIIGGVEIFILKGDLGRMNTVFKFYLQAWLFLSIASGVMLALLARRAAGSRWLLRGRRRVFAVILVMILLVPFIYTLLATPVKVAFRFTPLPPTLDGMAYMGVSKYSDEKGDMAIADDFMAINWMLDNIPGTPVIAEGIAPIYHWRSRVSVYTGLPSVIGWDWHQTQQRGDFGFMIERRVRDTEAFFNGTSRDVARQYLDRYGVEYVYVGGQERGYHSAQGLQKFEEMVGTDLREVYKRGQVTIYQVVR